MALPPVLLMFKELKIGLSMKIGFKKGHKFYSSVVRALTHSQWSHAAALINGRFYESTALKGEYKTSGVRDYPSTPEIESEYEWFDSCVPDELALKRYEEIKGFPYDYLSLLAFFTLKIRDSRRFYCYEAILYMMVGDVSARVTPEVILWNEVQLRGNSSGI